MSDIDADQPERQLAAYARRRNDLLVRIVGVLHADPAPLLQPVEDARHTAPSISAAHVAEIPADARTPASSSSCSAAPVRNESGRDVVHDCAPLLVFLMSSHLVETTSLPRSRFSPGKRDLSRSKGRFLTPAIMIHP